MNLLPKSKEEFNQKEYWDSFFKKRGGRAFEWYGEYPELCVHIHKYVKVKEEILMVGCGNSILGNDMFDVGFENITSIDISEVAIRQMKSMNSKRSSMRFLQMDALNMTFEDDQFGAIIDKGTLDAMMPNDSTEIQEQINKYFKEISRVLKNGGRYICISLLQKHILNAVLQYFSGNNFILRLIRCYEVESLAADAGESPMPIFIIVCTKFKSLPMKILEVDMGTTLKIRRLKENSELIDYVKSIQDTAFICAGLKRTTLSDDENVSFDVFAPDETSPRYTIYIVDKLPERKHSSYAAFIVPQGREAEWLFSTKEGRHQLAYISKCNRLAVITLHRNQKYESLDSVKLELSDCVRNLSPATLKKEIISFLSIGIDIGNRNVVCEGNSNFSGNYVIEDVECSGYLFRRLYYLGTPSVIQSEAKLKLVVQKYIVDLTYLTCFHHIYISRGLNMALLKKNEGSTLIIGLGGGGLCSFVHKFIPKMHITAVDIDEEMYKIAKNWFGLETSEKLKVEIIDGIKFLENACKDGIKYDAIVFDVDSKDTSIGLSCPPQEFLSEEVFKNVVTCLRKTGYFILNLVIRNNSLREKIVKDIQKYFANVLCYKMEEDLNEIFFCTNYKISKDNLFKNFKISTNEINDFFIKHDHKELVYDVNNRLVFC